MKFIKPLSELIKWNILFAESAKQTSVDLSAECTEEKWTSVESRLIDIMDNGGDLTTQALPFDAASDVPMEEQKFVQFLILAFARPPSAVIFFVVI